MKILRFERGKKKFNMPGIDSGGLIKPSIGNGIYDETGIEYWNDINI